MHDPIFIETLEERQFMSATAAPADGPRLSGASTVIGQYVGRLNYRRATPGNLGVHTVTLVIDKDNGRGRVAGTVTVSGMTSFRVSGKMTAGSAYDFKFAHEPGFFRGVTTPQGRLAGGMCIYICGVEHAGQVRLGRA